jgi:hypothetical protein
MIVCVAFLLLFSLFLWGEQASLAHQLTACALRGNSDDILQRHKRHLLL